MTGARPCELDSRSGSSRADSDQEDSLGSPAVRFGAGTAAAAAARTRVAAALVEKQQCAAEFAARLDAHFSAFERSEAAGGRGGMQESAKESAAVVAQTHMWLRQRWNAGGQPPPCARLARAIYTTSRTPATACHPVRHTASGTAHASHRPAPLTSLPCRQRAGQPQGRAAQGQDRVPGRDAA